MKLFNNKNLLAGVLTIVVSAFSIATVEAAVDGISGTTFNLTASDGRVSTGDGNSVYFWGFGETGGSVQYPAPTLIVNQGDTVTINLTNTLNENVSIIFPGQENVTASAGVNGVVTQEAAAGNGMVSYTFTATHAGTYLYHSGTNMDKQVEMGLLGAIIVRPPEAGQAYGHQDSRFDREYLYLMSEMDLDIHEAVERGEPINTTDSEPEYWFINGRTAVDTLFDPYAAWLPTQPYNSLPLMHPGERLLLRVLDAGKDPHPLHPHGHNFTLIAQDGRLLQSAPGQGADLAYSDYTLSAQPGSTYDFLFEWTGDTLNWDIYGTSGHDCISNDGDDYDDVTHEYCPNHNKPLPVSLPELQDVVIGGFYSGSPFLGGQGDLPPGEGGLNPFDGYFFPWHSHHEKELTNFDIYPGGMLTFLAIVPWDFPLD